MVEWFESIILRAIETDPDKRYHNYSEMLYELENPQKVRPYFDKNTSFFEKYETTVYRIGFIVMFILNIIQLLL